MEIKLKVDHIDYGSLAVSLLPLIGDKLKEHEKPAVRLLSGVAKMPPAVIRGTIDRLPQETKDELVALLINHNEARLKAAITSFAQNQGISLEMFIQYTLYRQWKALKAYTNKKGIEILGDVPFYVGIDSEDVWSSQKSFLLDDDGRPTFIAGVPPDYFSATGQRWGNPIYDWTALRENNFKFWVERLAYSAELFDIIRIDHFRAFDTYWKIPASCPTAIEGVWMEAPGYELFDEVFEQYPEMKIVAEDLGDLRPEVITLRDHYQFKGMRVVQFTFDSKFMPEDPENLIIYTGTHDNQTIRGWVAEQPEKEKVKIRKYFKKNNYRYPVLSENFIAYAMDSKAEYAIVPMCDVLNLTEKARLNTPGTVGYPNWAWRMTGFGKFEEKISFLKKCVRNSKR